MRKRILLVALGLAVSLVLVGTASALDFDVTYTADNVVGAWFQNGASPISLSLGPYANDWRVADTATISLDPSTSYQIVWEVENILTAGSGNPGAFMAQISPADLLADDSLALSSAIWQVAIDYGTTSSGFNDPGLNWIAATEYGANSDPTTIWWNNNGSKPVAGIDGDAQWIWGPDNFGESGAPDAGDRVFVRVQFETVSIPDASTLFLLGSACLVGLAGVRRRFNK